MYPIYSRTEERQRLREKWKRRQEQERRYENLKQQKILEYDKKRAEVVQKARKKSSRRSRNRSSSKSSSHSWLQQLSTSHIQKPRTLFKKLDEEVPLFKDPESTQINYAELHRIKINIRRNIPVQQQEPLTEVKRDILNSEDIFIKRRNGEGCKPIFDRAEIKPFKVKEVEEQRTVVAIDREQSVANKSHTSKRHSLFLSSRRNCNYSPSQSSFERPRYHRDSNGRDSKVDYRDHHKIDRRNRVEKRRNYKEKCIERDRSKRDFNRSRSRERTSQFRQFIREKSYRDRYRDRSSERSYDRRDRGRNRDRDRDRDRDRNKSIERSRERRDLTSSYIEPMHVPMYINNCPRPMIVSPMISFRGFQIPSMGRGRHPNLMAPVRPFMHKFI